MQFKDHPNFYRRHTRWFFAYCAAFMFILVSIILLGNNGYNTIADAMLWPFFAVAMVGMALLFYRLYHIPCPQCLGKTKTRSYRKELPDHWSAYCPPCDTLWNLQLGNGD